MKALVAAHKGPVEQVMKVVDRDPPPSPSGSDVIVRVASAALNPVDWKMCEIGFYVVEWPQVFGCDMAGVVVEVGPDAAGKFKKGDRVWAYTDLGKQYSGTLQELVVVPADMLGTFPDDLTFDAASTLGVGSLTAALGLYEGLCADVSDKQGSPLVVYGASSSVGQYAVQLGKLMGRKVVGVASKKNHPLIMKLGADYTIDYRDEDWKEQVKAICFDLTEVFDAIGGSATGDCAELLGEGGGVIASTSPGEVSEALQKKISVFSIFLGVAYANELRPVVSSYTATISELLKEGKFVPNPVRVVNGGLLSVPEAFVYMREGKVSGEKIVVRLP